MFCVEELQLVTIAALLLGEARVEDGLEVDESDEFRLVVDVLDDGVVPVELEPVRLGREVARERDVVRRVQLEHVRDLRRTGGCEDVLDLDGADNLLKRLTWVWVVLCLGRAWVTFFQLCGAFERVRASKRPPL